MKIVGPYAAVLGEIARSAEAFRTDIKKKDDDQAEEFTVYCGLAMNDAEIKGVKAIIEDIKGAKEAYDREKGPEGTGAGRKAVKPYDLTMHTYHLEGFFLASADIEAAELQAIRTATQDHDFHPNPVVIEMNV